MPGERPTGVDRAGRRVDRLDARCASNRQRRVARSPAAALVRSDSDTTARRRYRACPAAGAGYPERDVRSRLLKRNTPGPNPAAATAGAATTTVVPATIPPPTVPPRAARPEVIPAALRPIVPAALMAATPPTVPATAPAIEAIRPSRLA